MLVIEQMLDVVPGAGKKIIDAKHVPALRQKPLTKVRAKKARSTGHEYSPLQMHQTPIDSMYLLSRQKRIWRCEFNIIVYFGFRRLFIYLPACEISHRTACQDEITRAPRPPEC
jgi:hypothetical protein